MGPTELIAGLENGDMSLIKSFRAHFIRGAFAGPRPSLNRVTGLVIWSLGFMAMTYIVGPVCRLVLRLALIGDKNLDGAAYWVKKRAKIVRVLRFIFPDRTRGAAPEADKKGLIVGFNHPSLHEVFGLVAWSLDTYPGKRNNFPTNLPWYESICTCAPLLNKLGIYITPMITKSTFNRLDRIHRGDDEAVGVISQVRENLLNYYFSVAVEFERTGDNTFAAPSTTRQPTVYPRAAEAGGDNNQTRLLPVMSSLMYRIARANKDRAPDAVFIPITVIPPKIRVKRLRGIKVFRRYDLIINDGFSMEEAKRLGRGIDRAFLDKLAESAPDELKYEKINARGVSPCAY